MNCIFERFLSLHKLTSLWHKERIRKRNENKKAFFMTMINISIVKSEQFCFSLFFTFYRLRKHEKQCRQNFTVRIFIYGGSMTAKAECRHKFRGLP